MKLPQGRGYLAIPGPSVMPDRVLEAMHRPAPNIYQGDLVKLFESMLPDLCAIARTEHNVATYISNGHGIWEAALMNTLSRGDRVLCLTTGAFGTGWAAVARQLGLIVDEIDFGRNDTIDPEQLTYHLRADTERKIRAVLVTHVDTATSVRNDINALRAAIDATGHDAALMVDCIASLGCDRFEMDEWGVDVMLAASQKGLMTPPGMGFIFFNDVADQMRETADMVTPYWDWRARINPEKFYQYFGGTPPTHHLYGLREALTMIVHEEGIEHVWARHQRLAEAYWAAFDVWGQGGPLRMNIADITLRSHAVTSLSLEAPLGTALRDWVEENTGVTLGIGLGMAPMGDPSWHGYFRVGHMGHVNAHMVLGVIGAIDAGLKSLGIPHGDGAVEAATKVIAAP